MYALTIQALEKHGAWFRIHEHAPIRTLADAPGSLPFPRDRLLKTILFRMKNGGWVLAALAVGDRLDYKRLAAGLGLSRGALSAVPPEDVEGLGFQVGGVGPVPPNDETRVAFDQNLLQLDVVYCGSGRNDRTLEVSLHDLVTLSNGLVFPFTSRGGA